MDEILEVLKRPLAQNPAALMQQLVEVESYHARLMELKREAMQAGDSNKGLLSDLETVIAKRLSLGQTLLRSYTEELKRSI